MYFGIPYFVTMLSINALPMSSYVDWCMGTVIKQFVTSSMIYKMNLCPLLDLGITFESMLNLDKGQ